MTGSTELNNGKVRCEYAEVQDTIQERILEPKWITKTITRRFIGVVGGEWKDRIKYRPTYPRKCEKCGNTLKNKQTYFTHVVSKHKVTGVVL